MHLQDDVAVPAEAAHTADTGSDAGATQRRLAEAAVCGGGRAGRAGGAGPWDRRATDSLRTAENRPPSATVNLDNTLRCQVGTRNVMWLCSYSIRTHIMVGETIAIMPQNAMPMRVQHSRTLLMRHATINFVTFV